MRKIRRMLFMVSQIAFTAPAFNYKFNYSVFSFHDQFTLNAIASNYLGFLSHLFWDLTSN
jgi:hypothetical protein